MVVMVYSLVTAIHRHYQAIRRVGVLVIFPPYPGPFGYEPVPPYPAQFGYGPQSQFHPFRPQETPDYGSPYDNYEGIDEDQRDEIDESYE